MNSLEIVRRIRAFEAGRPLPRGAALRLEVAGPRRTFFAAFLRMGGEPLPWAVAWGHGQAMRFSSAPEPRDRNLVAKAMLPFARDLLRHLGHPDHAQDKPDKLGQVWLPNPSHVEMLHCLAYTYTRARKADPSALPLLNGLGRAANWLFLESQRPGQMTVMPATEALKRCFVFPAEDVRLNHLGFCLAWLRERGPRDARVAAAMEAERSSVSTLLDPELERGTLEALVDQFRRCGKSNDSSGAARARAAIAAVLERECRRRFDLTHECWNLLHSDPRPVNPGVLLLVKESRDQWEWQYRRKEQQLTEGGKPFIPSPETDFSPAAAAHNYFEHQYSHVLEATALLPHDPDLQAEAIASGDAFYGTIVKVRDEGSGRILIPAWTVRGADDTPLRLREGSQVCLAKDPRLRGQVRSISISGDPLRVGTGRTYVIEMTGHKRDAVLPTWVGHRGLFYSTSDPYMLRKKGRRVWKGDGPGASITHRGGAP